MNLVIDAGNTLVKTAVFENGEVKSFSSFEKLSLNVVERLVELHSEISNVILSSVITRDQAVNEFLISKFHFVELNDTTPLPLENLYSTPKSLGNDRLAAAIGANALFPKQDVLSIDAGTCIKYDFVNAKNQYLGGGISPGIEMRFKGLNQFTDKLPLLNYTQFDTLIGGSTEESILSGVMNGVVEEVKGIIRRYQEQYPTVKVVFTGGYVKFFEKTFNIEMNEKTNIFADSFLVLKGLNHILDRYNDK